MATKGKKKRTKKETGGEEPYPCTLRVVGVVPTKFFPHSVRMIALITRHTTKRKKDSAAPAQTKKTLFGYLPSYSPFIEYTVTITGERITTICEWRRTAWWLTNAALKAALEPHIKADEYNAMVSLFRKPKSTTSELEALEGLQSVSLLFARHFAPDVWFDLACVRSGSKNVWGSYYLEPAYRAICAWQVLLNESLNEALFKGKLPLPKMNWDVLTMLVDTARGRADQLVPELDMKYEEAMEARTKADYQITGTITDYVSGLSRPPVVSHAFPPLDESQRYTFEFLAAIRTNKKYRCHSCLRIAVSNRTAGEFMESNRVAVQVAPSVWSTPSCIDDANTIIKFLDRHVQSTFVPTSVFSLEQTTGLKGFIVRSHGNNWLRVVKCLSETPGERVLVACPSPDTAEALSDLTDVIAYPLEQTLPPDRIDTLVLCFAHGFSLESMAELFRMCDHACKWPNRVVLVGDPYIEHVGGAGNPFTEMFNAQWFPVCDVHPTHLLSVQSSLPGLTSFAGAILRATRTTELPWADCVRLVPDDEFPPLYNQLLAGSDPNDYHIVCESVSSCYTWASRLQTSPPNGIHVHDKVYDRVSKRLDWVTMTYPMDPEGKAWEEPRNVAMLNRTSHSIVVSTDKTMDHSACCGSSTPGRALLANHKYKWATIQPFHKNNVPMRKHMLMILTNTTTKRQVYTVACSAISRLTLVGTLDLLDKILSPGNKPKLDANILAHCRKRANVAPPAPL